MKIDRCTHCGHWLVQGRDVMVQIDGVDWVHVTCTKHGVERWCREGRPHGDPLVWDRLEEPRWQTHQWDNDRAVRGPTERLRASSSYRGP